MIPDLKVLLSSNDGAILKAIQQFTISNSQTFSFPDEDAETKAKFVEALTVRLCSQNSSDALLKECCCCLRILARDKSYCEIIARDSTVGPIVSTSGIVTQGAKNTHNKLTELEAQKCLYNVCLNSDATAPLFQNTLWIDGLLHRIELSVQNDSINLDILYNLKILFLLTAKSVTIQRHVCCDLQGVVRLTKILGFIIRRPSQTAVSTDFFDVVSEILKILFNVLAFDKNEWLTDNALSTENLVEQLRIILTETTQEEIHRHTIHLLTLIPHDCIPRLAPERCDVEHQPAADDNVSQQMKILQNISASHDMRAIDTILGVLRKHMATEKNVAAQESIPPLVSCLAECCRACRIVRKYCRWHLLPALTKNDVVELPNQGAAPRNHLCRWMLQGSLHVRECVADFIFVLCKEKVARFVKYVGYGNAAGLLASRSLLNSSRGSGWRQYYESDGESTSDTDSEDYTAIAADVNPITGRYDVTQRNPFAGMTEEQKDVEAQKLFVLFDRLNASGVIRPCITGADGTLTPVESIQQLLHNCNSKLSDVDSDDELVS